MPTRSTSDPAPRGAVPSTRRVVTVSLFVDVIDVVTNLVVLLLTGSAVIFAEMAMGVADVMGSLLLVVGERRARRPRDTQHPFGYGREAFFWTLLSALVLLVVGGGLATLRGWQQLVAPNPVVRPGLALAVVGVSIATNSYAVSLALRKLARQPGGLRDALRSPARPLLKTSLLRDLIGTASSLVGLLALGIYAATGSLLFDGLGAVAVGLSTVVLAGFLVTEARALIAGRAVPVELSDRLRAAALRTPGVDAVNRLVAVHAGRREILVDLDLDLAEDLDTRRIEALFDEVRERIRTVAPEVTTVRVDLNSP